MSNTLITPTVIAKEALMQLENHLVLGGLVHRQYKKEFVKVGGTVNIRKPVRFYGESGATISALEDVYESNTSITIDTQEHVAWQFSSQELTLTIEEYSERYIKPACSTLANKVDTALASLYKYLNFAAGTAGVAPNSFASLAAAAKVMDKYAMPDDGNRLLFLEPGARWAMADALKGTFDSGMAKDMIRRGRLGEIANFDIYGMQGIQAHTMGIGWDGSVAVKTTVSSQGATSLVLKGMATSKTGAVKAGDVFTVASVYGLNPANHQSTGLLMQFVATADADSDGSGDCTVSVYPEMRTSADTTRPAWATINAFPQADAVVTPIDSHYANLAIHKNCFALVMVPLELPDGAAFKARETYNNLSIRVIKDYDFTNDKDKIRLDILFGVKCIYPEIGVRLCG